MKKTLFFICFSLSLTAFYTSCSSDYENCSDVSDSMLSERKSQIMEMASDYGLDGYVIDDNKLRKNFLISDREIENEMRALVLLKGTYSLVTDDNRNFRVGNKKLRRNTRRRSIDNWPDDPLLRGEANQSYIEGDSVLIDCSFTIEFHRMSGLPQVKNPSFHAIIKVRDGETNEPTIYTFNGTPNVNVSNIIGAYPNFTVIGKASVETIMGSFEISINASFTAEVINNTANVRFFIIQ